MTIPVPFIDCIASSLALVLMWWLMDKYLGMKIDNVFVSVFVANIIGYVWGYRRAMHP